MMGHPRGGMGQFDPQAMLAMMKMAAMMQGGPGDDMDSDDDSEDFDDDLFDEDDEDYDEDVALSTFGDAMMRRGQRDGDAQSQLRNVHREVYKNVILSNRAKYEGFGSVGKYKITNPKCQAKDFTVDSARMDWELETSMQCEDKPSVTAHVHYKGTMKDGYDEKSKKIGTIQVILVKAASIVNAGLGVARVLDEFTQDLFNVGKFYERIERDGGSKNKAAGKWVNHIGDSMEISSPGALLYVESIEVETDFRGTGAGLYMLNSAHNMINEHMSLTLLTINPFFDDDDGEMKFDVPRDERDPNFKAATTKKLTSLIQYYRLIGFKVIGDPTGQGMLCVGHWNGAGQPDIETVVPHFF